MVWDVRDIPAPSTTGCCSRSATSRFSRRHTRSQTVPRFGIDDLRETVLLNAPDWTSPGRPNGRIPRGTTPARALPRSRLAPAAHGRAGLRRDTRARAHAAPPCAQDHPARSRPGFAEGAAAGCAGAPLLASAGGFRLGRAASRLVGRGPPPGYAARNDPGGVITTRTPAGNRFQPIDPQTDAYRCQTRPTKHSPRFAPSC
jgi:hypothetical protein